MRKRILKLAICFCIILTMSMFTVKKCSAHNNFWHRHYGQWHSHPHNQIHNHNQTYHHGPVAYYPRVQWFSYGTHFNAGPIIVSPDRRYVRMGINVGFSSITGYSTFNLSNGKTQYFRK